MDGNNDQQQNVKKRAPQWAMEPFEYFLSQTEHLCQVLHLTIQGISVLRSMPKVVSAVAKATDMHDGAEHEEKLAAAERQAELAQTEVDRGFPFVHSQAVVGLWSYLEALFHSFLVEWLRNDPQALRCQQVQKLRIRLGDYEQLHGYERYEYVVELLEKDIAIGLRNGTTRFEALLVPFGLSGEIPEDIKRDIYELGQVRNTIVHRAGVVDRQLLDACPWLGYSFGDEIQVSHAMFGTYMVATHRYVVLVICRVGEYFGVDMSDEEEGILASSAEAAVS